MLDHLGGLDSCVRNVARWTKKATEKEKKKKKEKRGDCLIVAKSKASPWHPTAGSTQGRRNRGWHSPLGWPRGRRSAWRFLKIYSSKKLRNGPFSDLPTPSVPILHSRRCFTLSWERRSYLMPGRDLPGHCSGMADAASHYPSSSLLSPT